MKHLRNMWRRGIEYKIQELLGEGGQGSVYKVLRRDRATGLSHTVAAKILHSKNAVDVWRREFESLARVRSPYCVQVHAFERLNGRPALILEYVEGVSLLQLARAGVLSASDTREISAQLESALLDLNSSGLFHGDLSPANVLVDIEGRIRLLDFGLANCTGDAGLRRLTPEFAAPERLQGARAGLASDLFSLGRIENFLLGRKSSLDIHSPYLNVMPEARSTRGLVSQAQARRELGLKVFEALERRRHAERARVSTLAFAPSLERSWKVRAVAVAGALLMLSLPGASQSKVAGQISVLHVRTKNWTYLSLNGSPLGYSPVSVPLTPGKTYILEWLSASAHGQKRLLLKAGADLKLTDRDFSH